MIAIEHDLPRFHVDDVEFRLLHQRAHLVKAANQQMGGAGLLRLAEQLTVIDVAHRTGVGRTLERCVRHPSARRQIAAQRGFELTQAPAMVGALIDHLTRGVDIVDFGDREHGSRSLRVAWPDWTGAENAAATKASAADGTLHLSHGTGSSSIRLRGMACAMASVPAGVAGSTSAPHGSMPHWRPCAGRSAGRRPAPRTGHREFCRSPRIPFV